MKSVKYIKLRRLDDTREYNISVRCIRRVFERSKTESDMCTTITGRSNMLDCFNRKIELACMRLIVDTAFHENRDFHEIADCLRTDPETGRFDFSTCDCIHINGREPFEDIDEFTVEVYNDYGNHYMIRYTQIR